MHSARGWCTVVAMRVAVVGHVEWVEFVRVDHVPATGEILHAIEWWEEPGGGGAGAAVQLCRLAGAAAFFTALGGDDLGRRARVALEGHGLEVHAAPRRDSTRRAITHVDSSGERTITVLGDRLAPGASDPLPWEDLAGADAVYFTAGDEGALRSARRARILVATARVLPLLQEAGVRLDALVGSSTDASEAFSEADLEPRPALSVWTDGAKGGAYSIDGERASYEPAPAGPIVDRYGAGDSFAAGLTYALAAGMHPREALAVAARCGAAVVGGRGPYAGQLGAEDL
jgi:ribokinase